MKTVYCENCGMRLNLTRKAMPKFGRIINLVEHHECSEEVQEFDLTPIDVPISRILEDDENRDKFVQKLNGLSKTTVGAVSTADLRDRRPSEQVKSTAPVTLVDQVGSLQHTTPARDMDEKDV